MGKRNIFISYSYNESKRTKDKIVKRLKSLGKVVDYSENKDKNHLSDEEIWNDLLNRIRGSSTTIVILSLDLVTEGRGTEGFGFMNSGWVYKEISASLRDKKENNINGVIAVVPDKFYDELKINFTCDDCGEEHYFFNENKLNNIIIKNLNNVKSEFKSTQGCYSDWLVDSYISIIRLSHFLNTPEKFLENAWNKRKRQMKNKEFNIEKDLHNI